MKPPPNLLCDADPNAISIEEARERISQRLSRFKQQECIDCRSALGRVVAEDIISAQSVPAFRVSAMDGYAVRVEDCTSKLTINGVSLAGHPGSDTLAKGSCQRITTGAKVPDEADTVVQQENVEKHDNYIVIKHMPTKGLNVRFPGSDSPRGAVLIKTGCIIGAVQLALLAAHGVTQINVYRPLTVALFSTGDELANPGTQMGAGQIYDANRPLLQALLANQAVKVVDLGIAEDKERDITQKFNEAQNAQLIISSGGVSVGEADLVRVVLEKKGEIALWKIAMKPGRPLTFGLLGEQQAYFGLPGNPVSAAITALLFVQPAIRHILGLPQTSTPSLQLRLETALRKNPGRVEYQRAIMAEDDNGDWFVSTTGLQESHVLTSLHHANCLIELPLESSGAKRGDTVRVIPFSHFSPNIL